MMKFAVVTPYSKEPLDVIRRCHDSVMQQTGFEVAHVLVADGFPDERIDGWNATHIKLPRCSADSGATPRGIGAACVGAWPEIDGMLFLDADNWFDQDHVANLAEVQRATGAAIVTGARKLIRPDGSCMGDDIESDGISFNDPNCYLLMRSAFPLSLGWLYQESTLHMFADRFFWNTVRQSRLPVARAPRATINYLTFILSHYTSRGESPPPGARNYVLTSIPGDLEQAKPRPDRWGL